MGDIKAMFHQIKVCYRGTDALTFCGGVTRSAVWKITDMTVHIFGKTD